MKDLKNYETLMWNTIKPEMAIEDITNILNQFLVNDSYDNFCEWFDNCLPNQQLKCRGKLNLLTQNIMQHFDKLDIQFIDFLIMLEKHIKNVKYRVEQQFSKNIYESIVVNYNDQLDILLSADYDIHNLKGNSELEKQVVKLIQEFFFDSRLRPLLQNFINDISLLFNNKISLIVKFMIFRKISDYLIQVYSIYDDRSKKFPSKRDSLTLSIRIWELCERGLQIDLLSDYLKSKYKNLLVISLLDDMMEMKAFINLLGDNDICDDFINIAHLDANITSITSFSNPVKLKTICKSEAKRNLSSRRENSLDEKTSIKLKFSKDCTNRIIHGNNLFHIDDTIAREITRGYLLAIKEILIKIKNTNIDGICI